MGGYPVVTVLECLHSVPHHVVRLDLPTVIHRRSDDIRVARYVSFTS